MDTEEIARLVRELRVSNTSQETTVTLSKEDVAKLQERLGLSLVGKIFSRRMTNRETLRSQLPRILRLRGNADIEMVGLNLFVITFSLESDKRTAFEEGPWHYFQYLLILKQAKAMQTSMEVEFNDITLWIQCHNIPFECMEPSIIKCIGSQVGSVEEVDVGEDGLCVGKFARIRVTRPIDEPLVRCVPIHKRGVEKEVLIIIQYERLPDFCFGCGRVGHISRGCDDKTVDITKALYVGWLRAGRSFSGRQESGCQLLVRGTNQARSEMECSERGSKGKELENVAESSAAILLKPQGGPVDGFESGGSEGFSLGREDVVMRDEGESRSGFLTKIPLEKGIGDGAGSVGEGRDGEEKRGAQRRGRMEDSTLSTRT